MSTDKNSTQRKTVVVESLDDILGTGDPVTIAAEGEPKKSVFSKPGVDTTFLETPGEAEAKAPSGTDDESDEAKAAAQAIEDAKSAEEKIADAKKAEEERLKAEANKTPENAKEVLDDIQKDLDAQAKGDEGDEGGEGAPDTEANKGGRKGALVEAIGSLVKKGSMVLFDDAPDLEKYTSKDLEELIEVNISQQVATTAKNAPLKVFEQLDENLQEAVAYNLNGGKDVASVLRAVVQSQEMTDLSLENEGDQERIVREWLKATKTFDTEEIEDEIASIKDRGDLEQKATQFKPKLDKKQATILDDKLKEQEKAKERAAEASKKYGETIYNVLANETLNGIPIGNKVQTMLYYGLTDNKNYQDRNGNQVNALGHLIEELQFGENPDPGRLAEALWLMADPTAYRKSVMALGEKNAAASTMRDLKTAEQEKITSSNKTGDKRETPTRTVKRKAGTNNIFTRK
jgi:hypothetical protein